MPQMKRAAQRKRRSKVVLALGAAGLSLSLVSSASAAIGGMRIVQPSTTRCGIGEPDRPERRCRPGELLPFVKRKDVVGWGVFANNHFAFPSATLLMNRKRHTIPVDLNQESASV
jgi:hypothetical protein